jgi:hypothetical protein
VKLIPAKAAAVLGVAVMFATPTRAAVEFGQSATFSVGAIVVDVCQVADAYRTYIKASSWRANPLCAVSRPASGAAPTPVTTVTRAENGMITALKLEF